MKISPARLAAYEVLHRIEREKAFSSVLLPAYEEDLEFADRGLCHKIVLGVLRTRIFLDRVIDKLNRGKKLDPEVRHILRIGIYQLRFLDRIPAYSAINESVNLTQRVKKTSAKGFVNAVLRKISREHTEPDYSDRLDRLSIETSHPKWLLEKWIEDIGFEAAEKLAKANNEPPRTAFRLTAKGIREVLKVSGTESASVRGCYFADESDIDITGLTERGAIYLQDEGSQLVGNAAHPESGSNFLDVCAAPGSKTTQICSATLGKDVAIAAGDLHWPRVQFLRTNVEKQGCNDILVVQYNAEMALPFAADAFDTVLVDAPCTGTGTIRHNPEIRYFLEDGDFAKLSLKQLRILTNASKVVKRGGRLLYSTCSLEPEENEKVAAEFMGHNTDFQQILPNVPGPMITSDGFARTVPGRDDMDGFFIAAFERV